ncbi:MULTISPECIES: efflux RND transporter periplasmic adaptor subunit [Dyella]|uniref:Efflux RND transporter periplasmic adaptor subunit n=2 Tax=Dyella TaxID=231454 RepID=A0A4R0YZ77_9GAMM|nr:MULTISPECIES: efflux RND transporter periplasmic adaptor subunit [Dyella]TBR40302.1 efflux RND transporter periplasmic adaptor subunit [Dyella terrae]TCI12116.1 efflux RND transporter periplasmic adaptor subunit [Dyella soli]
MKPKLRWICLACATALVALHGCKDEKGGAAGPHALPVGVVTIGQADVPMVYEFVGETESSQEVEIRARVSGFLEQRVYTEGSMVHAGDVLFRMDAKPFKAALDAAQAELRQQKARLQTAQANLNRVKPLAAKNALSQKDLDDATGQQQAAAAAFEQARANVTSAELNLGYTTITSPVDGLSSFAKKQDGSYIDATNSLLTYVAKLDPMRVNFSLSENEFLQFRNQTKSGVLKTPAKGGLDVQILLADGSAYQTHGKISFSDAALNSETGTYLIRADFANPEGVLRPGQFVRVKIRGARLSGAISVPQVAVQQGDRGAYVWTVDKDGKAAQRVIESSGWNDTAWIVRSGLHAGDRVVVDNIVKLAPGMPLSPHPATAAEQGADIARAGSTGAAQ